MEVDVAIIGGGPAGTAAALTLRKRPDLSVAVFERGSYGVPKIGECLSPGARALLEYLGVWDRFERAQTLRLYSSEAAWGQDALGAMDFIFTSHGPGWSLDRQRFDHMLAQEAARAGAEVICDTKVIACTYEGTRWRLETDAGEVSCKYVIDAAGRGSAFSQAQGATRQRNDTLTAVSARLPPKAAGAQVTRVQSVAEGWWYAAPLPNGARIVSFYGDAETIHRLRLSDPAAWCRKLAEAGHIADLVDVPDPSPPVTVEPAFSALLHPTAPDLPILATGDAMAARDPLSSSGIPNALGGGIQAARVAADWLFGEGKLRQGYMDSVTLDHQAYLRTHWRTYRIETRWPEAPFWRFRTAEITRAPGADIRGKPASGGSIFVPAPAAAWILQTAQTPMSQSALAQAARARFPSLSDERLLLAIEDLTECA